MKLIKFKPFLLTTFRPPQKPSLAQPYLQNLLVFELNRIPTDLSIRSIASGEALPLLMHLYINVTTLRCTSFKAETEEVKSLQSIYRCLTELSEQKQLRPHLNVYIHGVRLDLTRPFEDYHFDKSLIKQHTENRKSGLTVQPCYSVSSTNFADVLENYPLPENPDEATQRYDRFHELYTNIHVVKLNGSVGQHPTADLFLDFLGTCNGLTGLVIESSELVDATFYRKLANVESCRTLRTLKIAVEDGAHVDQAKVLFESCLPSFSFLRRFETNLATYENMLQLLGNALREGQNFVLQLDEYLIDIRQTFATEYQATIRYKAGEPTQFLMPDTTFLTLEAMLETVRDQLDRAKSSSEPEPSSKRQRTD